MNENERPALESEQLAHVWSETLPSLLNAGDTAVVQADGADPYAVRVHIDAAGHTGYSFDFNCKYVDSRELEVGLVDVERDGRSVDEHTDVIQTLAEDYVRHIHECAQALQEWTHD